MMYSLSCPCSVYLVNLIFVQNLLYFKFKEKKICLNKFVNSWSYFNDIVFCAFRHEEEDRLRREAEEKERRRLEEEAQQQLELQKQKQLEQEWVIT